jgi:hypothetical protein
MYWLYNALSSSITKWPSHHELYYQEFFVYNVLSYLNFKQATRMIISNSQWYRMVNSQDTMFNKCSLWIQYLKDIQNMEYNKDESELELYPTYSHLLNERNRVLQLKIKTGYYTSEYYIHRTINFRIYDTTVGQLDSKIKQEFLKIYNDDIKQYHGSFVNMDKLVERKDIIFMEGIRGPVEYPLSLLLYNEKVGHTVIGRDNLDTLELFIPTKAIAGCDIL